MTDNKPKVNDIGFVRQPKDAVVAMLPAGGIDRAATQLADLGVDLGSIDVLEGPKGEEIFDFDGDHHGFWAHVTRSLQKAGSSRIERENYRDALRQGMAAVLVPAADYDSALNYARVLADHGGQRMLYFATETAEQLSF